MTSRSSDTNRGRADDRSEPVVLHSTLLGSATALLSPALLIGLGLLAAGVAGLRAVPVTLLAVGLVTGTMSALTFPRRVLVGEDGVTRVCWGRRHHLPWTQVATVSRAPRSRFAVKRELRQRTRNEPDVDPQVPSSGLLARGHGRRSWMLTDQPESQAEYDAVAAVLDAVPATRLRAERPPQIAAPTDLYRRRRT